MFDAPRSRGIRPMTGWRNIVLRRNERKGAEKRLSSGRFLPCVFLLSLGTVLFAGAPAGAQGGVDLIDTWTDAGVAGWTNSGPKGSLANGGGYLNLRFGAQSRPESACDIARRPTDTGIIITNVSFAFRAIDMRPSAMRLYLHSNRSGNSWYVNLDVGVVGEWMAFSVPMTYAAGWVVGPEGTEEQFLSDIQSVDWIGVYVRRSGSEAAQNYGIDNVWITGFIKGGSGGGGGGVGMMSDNDTDGISDSWEVLYGLSPGNAGDAEADDDHDGMNNRAEFRAGTAPNNGASKLEMNLSRMNKGTRVDGLVVEWSSAASRTYRLLRTSDLAAGFAPIATGIGGTPPKNVFEDTTATNGGSYFYKVQVE